MVQPDPFMPAHRRFPRDPAERPGSCDVPSAMRPFIMRGLAPGNIPAAKHRTPATSRKVGQTTTSDGKNPTSTTDYYNVPDD